MTTLGNSVAILKLFKRINLTQGQCGLTFTAIVEALRLPKSTVSRLLATMESEGLLERDPESRCFRLGRMLLSLTSHYLSTPLVDCASPMMVRLAAESSCTGYISMLDGREIMVMRLFQGRMFIQLVTPPGSRMPAAQTSVGRALLARHSDDFVRKLYQDDWQAGSPNSPQTIEQLLAELDRIRQRGWSLARNETLQGLSSLSTTVTNKHLGETVALCLSFPSLTSEQLYLPATLDALQNVTHKLAGQYDDHGCSGAIVASTEQ